MDKRSIADLIVGAARGEPLPLDERNRLEAAFTADPALRGELRAQQVLGADLVALGRALEAAVPTPVRAEEAALLAAYRHARSALPNSAVRRRRFYAGAAAAAVAGALAAAVVWQRGAPPGTGGDSEAPLAAAGPPAAGVAPAMFQALPYGPGVSARGSYSVVRVRIPVSALTASYVRAGGETVEADVLIGEDGLVNAIRFDRADTLPVSMNTDSAVTGH